MLDGSASGVERSGAEWGGVGGSAAERRGGALLEVNDLLVFINGPLHYAALVGLLHTDGSEATTYFFRGGGRLVSHDN